MVLCRRHLRLWKQLQRQVLSREDGLWATRRVGAEAPKGTQPKPPPCLFPACSVPDGMAHFAARERWFVRLKRRLLWLDLAQLAVVLAASGLLGWAAAGRPARGDAGSQAPL